MQNAITQGKVSNIQQMPSQVQPALQQPCYATAPQVQAQPQPNYAGVNIQIFNPMVGTPQGTIYPQQTGSAYASGTQGGCYPAGYYTGQYPAGTFVPSNPYANSQGSGTYDMNGVYYPSNPNGYPVPGTTNPNGQNGYYDQNGVFHPTPQTGSPVDGETVGGDASKEAETVSTAGQDGNIATETDKTSGKDDSNIGTENKTPVTGEDGKVTDVADTNSENVSGKDENKEDATTKDDKAADENSSAKDVNDKGDKKTEKRKVVELSDDYIKTLENYLNSQDSEVRLMGAKEVVSRAMEDDSRKDDPALTALVNKMLQDPSSAIRAIALSLIDSRTILGDDYTVNVLKNMQTSQSGFGQDSVQATSALLKMAGKTIEKEFEVKETPKTDKN